MKKEAFTAEFWLKQGYNQQKHGEYGQAIESYLHGIILAPEKADGYLSCAKAYMGMEDFEQALKACDVGISYAQEHKTEPWAKKLRSQLEAGKTQISKEYTQSQYGTFSS